MTYSCSDTPTVLLTHKRRPTYQFTVCDKHKTDSDFAEGFKEEKIK